MAIKDIKDYNTLKYVYEQSRGLCVCVRGGK